MSQCWKASCIYDCVLLIHKSGAVSFGCHYDNHAEETHLAWKTFTHRLYCGIWIIPCVCKTLLHFTSVFECRTEWIQRLLLILTAGLDCAWCHTVKLWSCKEQNYWVQGWYSAKCISLLLWIQVNIYSLKPLSSDLVLRWHQCQRDQERVCVCAPLWVRAAAMSGKNVSGSSSRPFALCILCKLKFSLARAGDCDRHLICSAGS